MNGTTNNEAGAIGAGDILVVDTLTRRFGNLTAVRDASMRVAHGERRVILGPNGAGKSTLFNMIAGDVLPNAGTIRLNGRDVTSLGSSQRAHLGLHRTYQTSLLFDGLSVRDNIVVAIKAARGGFPRPLLPSAMDYQTADEAAERVGLVGERDRLVGSMSHGERRQLELAMALTGTPSLLLLDEPAAGLSPAERQMLIKLLTELPRSLTVLLIEHDMDVAFAAADQVTVMENGVIVVEGPPASVRSNPRLQAIYGGQSAHVIPA
jgi:branched-chain amino acid transport system ATP-binding protein